jgi:hypothetical protein
MVQKAAAAVGGTLGRAVGDAGASKAGDINDMAAAAEDEEEDA